MWNFWEEYWLPLLSCFLSNLPRFPLLNLQSDLFFISFIFFTLFEKSLISSKTSVARREDSFHFVIDVIEVDCTFSHSKLLIAIGVSFVLLINYEFLHGLWINHHNFIDPWSCYGISFGALWVKYLSCDVGHCRPTSSVEFYYGLLFGFMIDCFNLIYYVEIQSSYNDILSKNLRSSNRYCFVILFIIIVLIPFLKDLHEALTSSESELGFWVHEGLKDISFTLLNIAWYRRMVAYLLSKKSIVFSHQLIRFTKHGVEWLFQAVFSHIELR